MKKALLAVLLAAVFAAGCGSGSEFTASTTLSPEDGPAVVMLGTTERGRVLTDGMGRSLYLFSKDRPNTSACRGDCAATWPPHLLGERPLREGPGVRGDLLGTVRRPDGTRQVSYAGH